MGRFVLLTSAFALIFLAIGFIVVRQPGVRLNLMAQDQEARFAALQQEPPPLDAILATPCASGPCLFVQAGGREFVVGAGQGSADGLVRRGLLSDKLDGVILTDLESEHLEGLIGLRDRSLEAGRRKELGVYGPAGTNRVVEGLNAMLEVSDADRSVRFGQSVLPFSSAPAWAVELDYSADPVTLFDSGVLQIHMFPVRSALTGSQAVIRFDYESSSLIVGGCGARLEDIRRAAVEAKPNKLLVLPASSPDQLDIIKNEARQAGMRHASRFAASAADFCLAGAGLKAVAEDIEAQQVLASPLYPSPETLREDAQWSSDLNKVFKGSSISVVSGEPWRTVQVGP